MRDAAFTVSVRYGEGVRSLLLGLCALLLLAGAAAVFKLSVGGEVATLRLLLALGVFFVAAPTLLVKGLAAAWRALQAGNGKAAAVAGLLLNGALLVAELIVAVLAWSTMHSGV